MTAPLDAATLRARLADLRACLSQFAGSDGRLPPQAKARLDAARDALRDAEAREAAR